MENIEVFDKEQIFCAICQNEFDDDEYLPEVLQCGHTFCHSCIRLKSGQSFPKCCSLIYRQSSSTNDYILKLKKLKIEKISKTRKELEDLQKYLVSKRTVLLQFKDECMEVLDCNLKRIDKLLNNSEAETDFKLDITKIRDEVSSIKTNIFFPKIYLEPSGSPISFLKQIHKKLKSGAKLATVHQRFTKTFCTEILYGKISTWKNNLYFHCLERREPEDDEEFIRFEDLKTDALSEQFKLFLRINISNESVTNTITEQVKLFLRLNTTSNESVTNTITIEPHESLLLHNFVRLFMGEIGTSYKNKFFELESEYNVESGDSELKSCSVKMSESARPEYMSISTMSENIPPNPIDESKDTIYMYGNCYGSFMLCSFNNLVSGEKKTLIGKVRSPSNVLNFIKEHKDNNVIIDSGIMFSF